MFPKIRKQCTWRQLCFYAAVKMQLLWRARLCIYCLIHTCQRDYLRLITEYWFYTVFRQAAAVRLPVDGRMKKFIREQVADGVHNVAEVQRHTEMFVKRQLIAGKRMSSTFNRRYFPLRRDYANIIYRWKQSYKSTIVIAIFTVSCLVARYRVIVTGRLSRWLTRIALSHMWQRSSRTTIYRHFIHYFMRYKRV